ncbi:MAG: SNF2-related protein [Nitrospirota bacterium]
MLFETPEDTYNAYKKFLKKEEYRKAYRCLEKILHEFPDDTDLLEDIVHLCVLQWNKPEMGRQWLIRLLRNRTVWIDYVRLSDIEARLGNIDKAKEYLKQAKKLQKGQPRVTSKQEAGKIFSEIEGFIKYQEWNVLTKKHSHPTPEKEKVIETTLKKLDEKKVVKPHIKPAQMIQMSLKEEEKRKAAAVDQSSLAQQNSIEIPSYGISLRISPFKEEAFLPFLNGHVSPLKDICLLIDYTYLTIQGGFDELLCLNRITNVDKYWYQIETVKKVLKQFHGRVLLCDEVGLGKTIEAGMLIKEYLLRGMVKNVLILTPAPLVSQWKEEMETKFGIDFISTEDFEFMKDTASFWENRFIIASINTAKSNRNMAAVIDRLYDLVVVDEAHHLRNRTTLAWKLVNQIQKKFIFLLTATPVQNNLIELFNLITLLKPGQFKTEKIFKQEYVMKGNLKAPANKERLRELLRDVMIRNTRSVIDLKLPKRFASTLRLEPSETEREIYKGLNDYLRVHDFKKPMTYLLLREAGSSPFALKNSLLNMDINEVKSILDAIDSLEDLCKGKALLEILMKNPYEKKVIFTQYIKSMDYITDLLWRHGIPHVIFRGDLPLREKDAAIERFREEIPVLVSTESGGEGRNLQFCNTIINFDLPWNPMRIEQRIGRLHRIGQTRDVFVFNLSVKETIEDYIIQILDNKINMFEMVIGEIEPVLGYLEEEKDFEDLIMEIWLKSTDSRSLEDGFGFLGRELVLAKQKYLKAKEIDDEILGEDYEM